MDHFDLGKHKLEFNNDILKIKKFIIQAKTHTIHKLTRKAKQLKSRKGNDEELKKFTTKADSIVSEILMIKKITHSQLGRFGMKNLDNLNKLMDTPVATEEKAMAKLISHKCLKPHFQKIVDKFAMIPTSKLLEINKKSIIKQKRKEKLKKNAKKLSAENNDDKPQQVESVAKVNPKKKNKLVDNESTNLDSGDEFNPEPNESNDESDNQSASSEILENEQMDVFSDSQSVDNIFYNSDEQSDNLPTDEIKVEHKSKKEKKITKEFSIPETNLTPDSPIERPTESNESKKKRQPKKMFVDMDENEIDNIKTEKTVDSFFMMDSGDNYLSLALPRPPDAKSNETQCDGKNRKMRRAAMFGNEVIPRAKKFEKKNYNDCKIEKDRPLQSKQIDSKRKMDYEVYKDDKRFIKPDKQPEKLHPSWEAKKKNTSIVAFQGKKVVFDS